MDPLCNVFLIYSRRPAAFSFVFARGSDPGPVVSDPFLVQSDFSPTGHKAVQTPGRVGFSPRRFCCRRRVCAPDFLFSARSRARMGTDVGVETPVYRRGSDPGMVFSARTRARMGSDVRVQTPVPPPRCPVYGPPCVALHVTIRCARHYFLSRSVIKVPAAPPDPAVAVFIASPRDLQRDKHVVL